MPRLSHKKRYFGTLKDGQGQPKEAYLQFSPKHQGFVVFNADNDRPLLRTAYGGLTEVRQRHDFALNGKSETTKVRVGSTTY